MAFHTLKPYNPSHTILQKANGNIYTEVDTDGYYSPKFIGTVAVIPDIGAKHITRIGHLAESSLEAEWASIGLGIHFALEKNQTMIALSNDNLGVVRSIIYKSPNKHDYAFYWYNEIEKLIHETMAMKIRWVPREMNRAGKGPEYTQIYKLNDFSYFQSISGKFIISPY
jgi:hypothetical protein